MKKNVAHSSLSLLFCRWKTTSRPALDKCVVGQAVRVPKVGETPTVLLTSPLSPLIVGFFSRVFFRRGRHFEFSSFRFHLNL